MVLQFTLAACLHKTLLIHVDKLFDVGLGLIEQLACKNPPQSLGCVCVCARACVCVRGGVNEAPVAVFVWMHGS